MQVVEASALEVVADALLVTVEPGEVWRGSLQSAVREVAGGPVSIVRWKVLEGVPRGVAGSLVPTSPTNSPSERWCFAVDGGEGLLQELVEVALRTADEAGCKSVSVPALRLGLMRGNNDEETLRQLALGAITALTNATHLRHLRFVFLQDRQLAGAMQALLLELGGDVWIECPQFRTREEVAALSGDGLRMLSSPQPGRLIVSEVCSGKRV